MDKQSKLKTQIAVANIVYFGLLFIASLSVQVVVLCGFLRVVDYNTYSDVLVCWSLLFSFFMVMINPKRMPR